MSRPDVEPTLLEDLPELRIIFLASAASMTVHVEYDEFQLGPCAALHESFRATVGEATMAVVERGSGDPLDECAFPVLQLEAPPPASSLVLEDDSERHVIDLGGRLARLLHLVPERPWTAEVGETVTARYAPADALRGTAAALFFVPADGSSLGTEVPFAAASDEISFKVPDLVGAGHLELRFPSGPVPQTWPCTTLKCQVVGANNRSKQPLEIQAPDGP